MTRAAAFPALMRLTLAQRLSLVFALLLLACCGASAWLQVSLNDQREQETVQRLSSGLAAHIAQNSELMDESGLKPTAVRDLFGKLMAVNPSVELYLLDLDGRIMGNAAPAGHLKRDHVDIKPIQQFLAGAPLPIFGDDPRSAFRRKVFSAAPLRRQGSMGGYVYVVLLGEEHDMLAAGISAGSILRATLWSMSLVALLGLLAGLIAVRLITRPLGRLTDMVQHADRDQIALIASRPAGGPPRNERDEIAILEQAFIQMARRIADQWHELTQQDQQRRDLVANMSHDLRTPLTSLHGYLETLLLKSDSLSAEERRRYLEIALSQSRKVGRLAQSLFELARLESGIVLAEKENFSLPELVQDVFQKFELPAEARRIRLTSDIAHGLPLVYADLGMIERVLTNLLDNAIRHTPLDGEITVTLRPVDGGVSVQVSDTGSGIPRSMRADLFKRPSMLNRGNSSSGGLGLIIVQRMLQLHESDIRLIEVPAMGAVFHFSLPAAPRLTA